MTKEIENLPQYYRDSFESDGEKLSLKLFNRKGIIRNMIYLVEGELIVDDNDHRLNKESYIDIKEERVSPKAKSLLNKYLTVLHEHNFDREIMHNQAQDDIITFASKYNLIKVAKTEDENNSSVKVKAKRKN